MAKATRKHSTRTPLIDPTFAAIDSHRKLDRAWLDLAKLEEAGSYGVTGRDVEKASGAAEEAAWRFARTRLTTAAGAAAMLAYIATGPITGLFELGEARWHENAFRTVVASLAEITGQSERAA
jgi:hypothetical protein